MILAANKNNEYISNKQLLLLFFPLLAIIILWFGHWQTQVIYGDDLGIYESYRTKTDLDIILESQKYRPVNTWLIRLLIATLGNHVSLYFYFNAVMQTLCALIFIKIADLFLRNIFFSCLLGLLVGLSRFNFYNITQLYNGGAMEVSAVLFFLGSLYYWLKTTRPQNTYDQNFRSLLMSILLANLCIYTHERYIVLFLFMLGALFIPTLSKLKAVHKRSLATLLVGSVAINYLIKQQVYHISFFMGTGNTHIRFSPASAAKYLQDALLDLIQFNSGPEYLSGYPYLWLSAFYKSLPIITTLFILLTVTVYLVVKNKNRPQFIGNANSGYVVLALFGLLLLTIGPAVVTIRLEQRWLQAAFAVLLIIVAAAIGSVAYNKMVAGIGITLFVAIFLISERNYLDAGVPNIYLSSSVRKAKLYKQAIDGGVIKPPTKHLIISADHMSPDDQDELRWVLQNGQFFEFYHVGRKTIQFADSSALTGILAQPAIFPSASQVIGQRGDSVCNIYP